MSNCIEHSQRGDRDGYGKTNFKVDGRWKHTRLHRVVFFRHNGYWPEVVRHTCDNPRCINPDHLLAGNNYDNMQDRKERGEFKGRKSRFTAAQVAEMRQSTETLAVLAARYGTTQSNVSRIRNGSRGNHVRG